MNWLLDVGNTRIKLKIGNQETIYGNTGDTDWLCRLRLSFPPKRVVISSVANHEVHSELNFLFPNAEFPNAETCQTFFNADYYPLTTLGTDRYFAAWGASHLAKCPVLVVDAGTCMTLDWADPIQGFQGGVITPGFSMRIKSMHEGTGRLPNLDTRFISGEFSFPGHSTQEALALGSIGAMALEIQQLSSQRTVFLCGGDAQLLANQLKTFNFEASVRLEPDLVLTGLSYYANTP